MSRARRSIIGGIGGLAPTLYVLLQLLMYDDITQLTGTIRSLVAPQPDVLWLVVGHLVRAIVFFAIGAIWVLVWAAHMVKPFDIFQLGFVAPSLLMGLLQGAQLGQIDETINRTTGFSLFGTAHAQELRHVGKDLVNSTDDGPWTAFLRGFVGGGQAQEIRSIVENLNLTRSKLEQVEGKYADVRSAYEQLTQRYDSLNALAGRLREENGTLAAQAQAAPSSERERALEERIAQLLNEREQLSQMAAARENALEERLAVLTEGQQLAGRPSERVDMLEARVSQLLEERHTLLSRLANSEGDASGVATLARLYGRSDIRINVGYGSIVATTFDRGTNLKAAQNYYSTLAQLGNKHAFPLGRAAAYTGLSAVSRLVGNVREAEKWLASAVELADGLGPPPSLGRADASLVSAYNTLGLTGFLRADATTATNFFEEAAKLADSLDPPYPWGKASSILELGVISQLTREPKKAEGLFGEAAEAFSSEGDHLGVAMANQNLAIVFDQNGRPFEAQEARQAVEEAIVALTSGK